LKKILENPETRITTREAIIWGKENSKPQSRPGEKHFYGDTNYYLLGLLVESVTNKHFHEVMRELIFEPLNMKHAYMFGFSKPKVKPDYPTAELYINDKNLLKFENLSRIDYAGGSVVAPLEEYLIFMKSLVNHEIIKKETLEIMLNDYIPMGFTFIGIDYGYGIWKYKTVPLIIPKKYNCWGCVGVTGAYMFYHPKTESYLIGTFNDIRYQRKAVQFMLFKVIKELLKINNKYG
jgi:D-alanyl-D-alanine carboxypeptidase